MNCSRKIVLCSAKALREVSFLCGAWSIFESLGVAIWNCENPQGNPEKRPWEKLYWAFLSAIAFSWFILPLGLLGKLGGYFSSCRLSVVILFFLVTSLCIVASSVVGIWITFIDVEKFTLFRILLLIKVFVVSSAICSLTIDRFVTGNDED